MRYNSTSKPTNMSPRQPEQKNRFWLIALITVSVIATLIAGLFIMFNIFDRDDGMNSDPRATKIPPEGYTRHTNDTLGMTFVLSDNAKELTLQDYDLAYRDGEYYFYVNAMAYQELEEATWNNMPDPWRTDVDGYSRDFVIKNNLREDQRVYDEEENIAVITNTYIDDEIQFYDHYVIMDNGEAIYLINFNCPADKEDTYKELFDQLDDYIYVSQR